MGGTQYTNRWAIKRVIDMRERRLAYVLIKIMEDHPSAAMHLTASYWLHRAELAAVNGNYSDSTKCVALAKTYQGITNKMLADAAAETAIALVERGPHHGTSKEALRQEHIRSAIDTAKNHIESAELQARLELACAQWLVQLDMKKEAIGVLRDAYVQLVVSGAVDGVVATKICFLLTKLEALDNGLFTLFDSTYAHPRIDYSRCLSDTRKRSDRGLIVTMRAYRKSSVLGRMTEFALVN